MRHRVRVWDLPTRCFHWALALAFLTSWLSAENDLLEVHFYSGYTLLSLLLFRLAWGFVGSSTARFRSFLASPARALAYLPSLFRADTPPGHGHSAAGGWMVIILIGLLLAQAGMGLFANDELLHYGPLSNRVSSGTAETLSHWHHELGEILPWLVGLHVITVLWIVLRRKQPIIRAMITGVRSDLPADADSRYRPAPLSRALVLLGMAAAAVAAVVIWG